MANTKIEISSGRIVNENDLNKLFMSLGNGQFLISIHSISRPRSIQEWRALYFLLRDIMFEEGETGLNKADLHELLKVALLDGRSTKTLTVQEWEKFVNSLKEFALEEYNCYL